MQVLAGFSCKEFSWMRLSLTPKVKLPHTVHIAHPGAPEHLLSCAFADPIFKAANSSLRALQATMGNSYKCNTEEHIQVTEAFSVNIFQVWVQAFQVEGNKFGSGE